MRGHQQLVEMRRAGARPDIVFVETDPAMFAATEDWHVESPSRAQVRIEPADSVHRLDLRFLVGLPVWVNGTDSARVFAVAEACERHQAGRVIASVSNETEVVEMADSQGDIAWPIC